MKKIFWLAILIVGVGFYFHNVQGWDWARARRLPGVAAIFKETSSATTTPIGQRGTGTHWETASPMPFARSEFGAALVGERIYVVGGRDGYLRTLSSVLAYDIPTDTWNEVAPLPQALHHVAVTTDGKKVYALGGMTGIASRQVDAAYAYDPLRNAWEELGRLNDFRGDAAAVFSDDRVYLLGGATPAGTDGAFEWYDADHRGWNGVQTMPTARHGHALAAVGGTFYALGGRLGTSKDLSAVERYTEAEGWVPLQDLPAPRRAFGTALHAGTLLVIGGANQSGLLPSIEAFDLKKNVWSSFPLALPHPRHGLAVVPYKNRVYAIGGGMAKGYSVSDVNDVLVFN